MQIIGAIEKGIRLSSLGLNPTVQDKEILVHVPRSALVHRLDAITACCQLAKGKFNQHL